MHIEPGVVVGGKILLSYATASGALSWIFYLIAREIRQWRKALAFGIRSALAGLLAFCFFEILPHFPVGVSEVHLIFGATLFLVLGVGPTAAGLTFGLVMQGLLFSPSDLPQIGMNLTTLLVPLLFLSRWAPRMISPGVPCLEMDIRNVWKLSAIYQAGIVAWVGFWTFLGGGFSSDAVADLARFGSIYLIVILVEAMMDAGILVVGRWVRASLTNARHIPIVRCLQSLVSERQYRAVS